MTSATIQNLTSWQEEFVHDSRIHEIRYDPSQLNASVWWDRCSAQDPAYKEYLQAIGDKTKTNSDDWHLLVQEATRRMQDQRIEQKTHKHILDWLHTNKPNTDNLPPILRLEWLRFWLTHQNHAGQLVSNTKEFKEMQKRGNQLYMENAPLVCNIDCRLAVDATNNFQFDLASQYLARWHGRPKAVPGLENWGKVQSSLGQHAAFVGDNKKAIYYFKRAIRAFEDLSNPAERQDNQKQTGNYLCIVMIDNPDITDDQCKKRITQQLCNGQHETIEALYEAQGDLSPYDIHLLLRWLVFRGTHEDKQHFHKKAPPVEIKDSSHPWPLVYCYQAMLRQENDPEGAKKLALKAAEIALNSRQGPTVKVIGACIRVIAEGMAAEKWKERQTCLEQLKEQLPAAKKHIENIEKFNGSHTKDFKLLLKNVLPFNFH